MITVPDDSKVRSDAEIASLVLGNLKGNQSRAYALAKIQRLPRARDGYGEFVLRRDVLDIIRNVPRPRFYRMGRDVASVVYFIQCNDDGPIKIGVATKVEHRLQELQVGNPYALIVRATTEGDEHEERLLHERFEAIHLRGEWFTPGAELLALIEAINHGGKLALLQFLGANA